MKHPNEATWTDYVRGLLSPETASKMTRHLDRGCEPCDRQVRAFRAVLQVAETDLRVEPPAFAVRSVKSLFRVRRLVESAKTPRLSLSLGFDSFSAPALAGVRSDTAAARHLVYESSALTLDLKLEASADTAALKVRGQLFDADSSPVSDVPAFLIEGGRIYSHDLSGSLGEFRLLGDTDSSPHLCLLIEGEKLVDLELPGLGGPAGFSPAH